MRDVFLRVRVMKLYAKLPDEVLNWLWHVTYGRRLNLNSQPRTLCNPLIDVCSLKLNCN
ncbi:hypothetical protein Tsubulata_007008 [Turnera subulata]|uniref:Uncharacterized protein n=1 Tax=Turnera subulata TaxID=218843 RepID=A0A9Q0IZR5_9ROSI|nr:hypothetical protein Tsubulata_007008 [Turnera subulata]